MEQRNIEARSLSQRNIHHLFHYVPTETGRKLWTGVTLDGYMDIGWIGWLLFFACVYGNRNGVKSHQELFGGHLFFTSRYDDLC